MACTVNKLNQNLRLNSQLETKSQNSDFNPPPPKSNPNYLPGLLMLAGLDLCCCSYRCSDDSTVCLLFFKVLLHLFVGDMFSNQNVNVTHKYRNLALQQMQEIIHIISPTHRNIIEDKNVHHVLS